MSITRYGITDGANGRPIISGMVVRDDTVYLCGITAADPGVTSPRRRSRCSRGSTRPCRRQGRTSRSY